METGMTDAATQTHPIDDDAAHLLIVDDDTRIRNLLSQYLSERGYRVTVAASAAEARRKLQNVDFDLLILDVKQKMCPSSCSQRYLKQICA
jgi:two-component system, OmpR family, phosphate regulon response regulator OmpR